MECGSAYCVENETLSLSLHSVEGSCAYWRFYAAAEEY
jgi:hypothetical protein